jgi:hypothetical protein
MSVQYVIDVEHQLVRTILGGIVTRHEVADYIAKLRDDPGFGPHYFELITFEGNPEIRLGYLDWHSLAECDPFSDASKRALVLHAGSALYGKIRMFQIARNEPSNIRVFETKDEALLWLSRPLSLARGDGG